MEMGAEIQEQGSPQTATGLAELLAWPLGPAVHDPCIS